MTIAMITDCSKRTFSFIERLSSLIIVFAFLFLSAIVRTNSIKFLRSVNIFTSLKNNFKNIVYHILQKMWFVIFNTPREYEMVICRTCGTTNNFCGNATLKNSRIYL